ncbi:acetyltransferase (GNAT) family protein [Edaphobacter modestus]|uniref:Acetyltransferase (GNAT) family protein n=2 Tax=Edaphobacter modestus TaxID=388466 RepID=A0A4Q7YUU6_9BACT|nr:acetyltransferase (GNAT) family protein [Edaphobacter modestus]
MSSTLCLADIPSNENSMSTASVQLRPFQPGDAEAFRCLNEAWIEKFFGLEEQDNKILGDPEGYVLAKGGHIFFAVADGIPIGCCALVPVAPGIYEVAKMAVAESWQGRGIGRRVLAYTIEQGRSLGADSLYLETNRRLANAIHLYESLGFRHLPPKHSPYARADVFMELRF